MRDEQNPAGGNCTTYRQPRAAGECYRTTFGDWRCNLQGTDSDQSLIHYHQPPPR